MSGPREAGDTMNEQEDVVALSEALYGLSLEEILGVADEQLDELDLTQRDALLGVEHPMTWNGLYECLPPAYTEHIGTRLLAHLTSEARRMNLLELLAGRPCPLGNVFALVAARMAGLVLG